MAENTFDGWIIIDDTHYQDAKTGEIKEIVRDSLRLDRIDQNGTIQEMLDTIDSNFMEIARHGGGPAGIDGTDGEAGADGSNVEYIYCRADEMKIGVQYPDTVEGIKGLFINIENSAITDASGNKYVNYPSNSNPRVKWFDHAQGVTREFKNEYALIRVKRGDTWFYPSEPVLWAHWGETGRDGDGVEYIFLLSNKSTTEDPGILTSVKKIGEMTAAQEAIYNIDDFYPGKSWFNDVNMEAARKVLKAAGAEMTESEFENRWRRYFGFCDGGYDWTDEPIGTDPLHLYEYVSIRKSTTDENDKKTWGNFSEPALWSNYSLPSRTFIIYKNMIDTQTPAKIDNGKGWWDTTTDKLVFDKSGYELPSGWTDENTEPEDNEITWMCSGIFKNTGENVYWSKPMRITGRDGKQGEDGTTIEFIYNLSNTEPSYPDNDEDRKTLFDNVEEYHEYEGWMDHPLSISPERHTEYVAIRSRESESAAWEYSPAPILWAHWGEDGTDGDGVEYIFKLSKTSTCTPVKSQSTMTGEIGKYAKIIFQMDDFYPDEDWFTTKHKNKAIEAVREAKKTDNTLDENYITNNWESLSAYLDQNWVDNPQGTSPDDPYEFVSIRRCDPDADTRVWTDFSEPALWSYYGKRTRTFIVYCNVPEAKVDLIKSPSGGWWDITNDTLQKSKNDASDYESDALTDMSGISGANVGVWQDDNNDVRGMITFMASGIFEEPGNLLKWSEPNRVTGATGEKGADGADIEFIYALEDKPVYPTTDTDKHILFEGVENADPDPITGFKSFVWPQDPNATKKTTWFDNAQAISKRTPTEYCWSRERKTNNNPTVNGGWTYTEKPFLWAHWGEDGTDGDGIEYIFHRNNDNSLDTNLYPNVTDSEYQAYIDLLYTMNDFYPGEGWFNISGISAEFKALAEEAGLDVSDWDTKWNQLKSKMKKGWTDNPQGTGPSDPYELVSIRKSHNDSNGKRVWEPFSEPVVWSTYSTSTRVFIIYCNMVDESTPGAPEGGWWNIEDEDGDIRDENNHSDPYKYEALTQAQRDNITNSNNYSDDEKKIIGYWMDTNEDDIIDNSIVWMSSGVFSNDGTCLGWSEPHRITGADGRPGADGSNIQFIYALSSDTIPAYPSTNKSLFFDSIEDPDHSSLETFPSEEEASGDMYICTDSDGFKYVNYRGSHWYDRAQVISPDNPTEYCASRRLPAGATGDNWVYDPAPFVWAHWGEDGTDGDGIEYIFMLTSVPTTFDDWEDYMVIPDNDTARTIFSMSDFRPNGEWFTRLKNETDTEPINMTKVKTEMGKNKMTFVPDDWNDMKAKFSFETASGSRPAIGTWTDNPGELSTTNQYQYVSIRREIDNVWEPFEKPVLWSKYYITRFTAFVFTTTVPDIDLTGAVPVGWNNDFDNPKPTNLVQSGESIPVTWSDSPEIDVNTGKTMVWMTSAQFIEGKTESTNPVYPKWSSLKRMADTNEFQVEWSSADLSNEQLTDLNNKMNEAGYNFKDILKDSQVNYNHDVAEQKWRDLVIAYTKNNSTYTPYDAEGVKFYDDVDNAVLMATCQMSNGEWTNWSIKRVKGEKGEKGEPGTSIKIQRRISYEIPLANANDTYNYSNASNAQENFTYDPAPENNNLAIVYPANETRGVYIGDETSADMGGRLYMWKYNATTGEWEDYNDPDTNGEVEGNTYISPNKHLILWDGDSWQDLGEFEGPEGKRWILVVKYAKDSSSGKQFCPNTDPDAKWIGTLTYLDNGTNRDQQLNDEDFINTDEQKNEIVGWNWQVFKGQDGYGYEYIFKTTNTSTPPHIPNKNSAWHTIANIEPGRIQNPDSNDEGWYDEPMEPVENSKYVWMCWRKFDRSAGTNGEWTDFAGKGDTIYARLWQVYAKNLTDVTEYYKAFDTQSPSAEIIEMQPSNTYFTDQWGTYYEATNGSATKPFIDKWSSSYPYLFNKEVITYSDGTRHALPGHFCAQWDGSLVDITEYYCAYSDGDNPPYWRSAANPPYPTSINNSTTKEAYQSSTHTWTTHPNFCTLDSTNKYLWNVTHKRYKDDPQNTDQINWSTPYVIGIYGVGENAVYADLDNEMDSIQLDENKKVLSDRTCKTTLKLYNGQESIKISNCEVSGEEYFKDNLTGRYSFIYRKNNDNTEYSNAPTGGADYVEMTLTIRTGDQLPSENHKIVFAVTSTNGIVKLVSYTLVGIVNSPVYSILPQESAVIEKVVNNSTELDPSTFAVTVIKHNGASTTTISGGANAGYKLYVTTNKSNQVTELSGTPYTVPSNIYNNLSAGDKMTFTINIENGGANTSDFETVVDKETVYILKQGTDGAPGASGSNGNGYQYAYALFDNNASYASAETIALSISNVKASLPTVTVAGYSTPLAVSTIPHGADKDHQYEYRSERSGFGESWSDWSNPVTIARYLDGGDIESTVSRMVSEQTATLASQITDGLNSANSRITNISNLLSGKFDASGNYTGTFSDGVTSGLVTAVTSQMDIPGQVTSTLNGFITTSSSATAFSDWVNDTTGDIATVQQSMTAQASGMASLSTQVTELEAETGKTATALTTLQADAQDHFASLDNSVANAAYLKNTDGYLLIDKPDYSIWFENMSDVNDPDERRNVDWILFKCNEVSISDNGGGDPIITEYTSQSLTPVISNNEDYYNDDKTKIIIVLQKYIATDTLESFLSDSNTTALNYYLNSEPNSVFDGQTISIKVKNDNSGEFKLFIDGIERDTSTYEESEATSQFYCVFRIDDDGAAVPENSYARLLIWTVLDLEEDNDSNNGYASEDGDWLIYNNSLSWNVGVSEIDGDLLDGGTYNLAHTKTASVFEEPLIKDYNGSTLIKDFTDDILLKTKRNKDFGYTLLRNTSGRIEEAETNGVLSTSVIGNNENNISMHFVPVDTPLEQFIPSLVNDPNTFNNTYPTTISDFSVKDYSSRQSDPNNGDTRSYYVVCAYGDSLPGNSFEYKITLPDSDKIGNNTVSFNQEPLLKNLHVLNPSIADGNSYNQDGTDYAQFSTDSNGFRVYNSSELYDENLYKLDYDNSSLFDTYKMFITSLYDEVNLTYNCTFSPSISDGLVKIKMELLWGTDTFTFVNRQTIFELDTTEEVGNTISYPVTYSGNLSCFEDVDLSSFRNGPLWFQVRLTCDKSSIGNIDISYKIETVNKLTGEIDLHHINTFGTYVAGDLDDNGQLDDVIENISGLSDDTTAEYIIGETENYGSSYSSSSTISMDNTKKEIHTYFEHDKNMISMFCISSTNKGTVLNLDFNVSNEINYMIIPSYYSVETLKEINSTVRYYLKRDKLFFKDNDTGFVNSEKYNTKNWTTINSNTSVKINFNDAYYDSTTNKYYYTIAQYSEKDCSLEDFHTYVHYTLESTNWWEQTSTYSKISTSWHPYYMLDKITVSVNDKSLRKELDTNRSLARNNNNEVGVTNYKDVRDIDKPYLITSVSELASISQTVNEGIACTSIVTSAGGSNAAAVFQASEDGSNISFLADRVGIKSTHFNLDKSGVTMQGNLYATDNFDNITAGVIGYDTLNTDVKFFAGTKIPKNGENYPDLQSMVEEAPFRVYEDGTIVLETKDKKTYIDTDGVLHASGAIISGDVSARSFNAEDTRNVEIDMDGDIYSGSINKTTTITGNSFSILASGTLSGDSGNDEYVIGNEQGPNGLFIEIVDKLMNPNPDNSEITDEYLYCVPVLCMVYNGQKYVLSPASWITNQISGQTDTDMYWEFVRPVYKYTFLSPSSLPDSYTGGVLPTKSIAKDYYVTNRANDGINNTTIGYTYYIFRDDLGKDKYIMNYSSFKWIVGEESDDLYKFKIAKIDASSSADPNAERQKYLNILFSHGLIDQVSMDGNGALTLESNILNKKYIGYTEGSPTYITDSTCNTFNSYLQNNIYISVPYNDTYSVKEFNSEFNSNYNANYYGVKSIASAIRKMYNVSIDDLEWKTMYNNREIDVKVSGYDYFSPFNSSGYGQNGGQYGHTEYYITLNWYPNTGITEYGLNTTGTTQSILVKANIFIYSSFIGYTSGNVISIRGLGEENSNYIISDIGVTSIEYSINFDFVLNLNTALSFDIYGNNSNVVSKIKSFLEQIDFEKLLQNPLESNIVGNYLDYQARIIGTRCNDITFTL